MLRYVKGFGEVFWGFGEVFLGVADRDGAEENCTTPPIGRYRGQLKPMPDVGAVIPPPAEVVMWERAIRGYPKAG